MSSRPWRVWELFSKIVQISKWWGFVRVGNSASSSTRKWLKNHATNRIFVRRTSKRACQRRWRRFAAKRPSFGVNKLTRPLSRDWQVILFVDLSFQGFLNQKHLSCQHWSEHRMLCLESMYFEIINHTVYLRSRKMHALTNFFSTQNHEFYENRSSNLRSDWSHTAPFKMY